MTRDEGLELVKKYDGKYPHYAISKFIEFSNLSKFEIDKVIDSFTNPILFAQDENGNFIKDSEGNLIRNFEIE